MATFPTRRMDHILAPNATEYERTLASQVDRLLDLNIPIRLLWNPWECPENLLPYLAWALSVDLWDSSWPVTKRRSVIANAIKHHRQKGTLQGIETYLDLVGSKILKADLPPSTVFSGPSLTRDEREAWLQKLPQIRVWRQYETSIKGRRIFSGGSRYQSFLTGHFPGPNDAITRMARRARWVVKGVETDAKVENFDGFFRVHIPGHLEHSIFCNTPFNKKGKFPVPSTAYQRIVSIEPTVLTPWRNSITPSLQAVTSEPELVAVAGKEGHAVYSNRINYNRFYIPSMSGYRLFERYAVNDGTAIQKRPSIQFMGVGRYGIKPKTAELKVEMKTKWPAWKARLNEASYPKSRFFTPHDGTLMAKNRQAVIAAKRLSDQILLDTNTKPGFVAGLPRWAGDPIVI
ncbi:phage tail protein I [Bradyrhizobium sp. th.b2]|uniref:phage tail protein I n=1 Tax=Bradyrhizobium sp. th-b2 TaxID=172088 RepID=UPI0004242C19|nr:phage tail protein I [Bradyrhizobium sp. th.b2]